MLTLPLIHSLSERTLKRPMPPPGYKQCTVATGTEPRLQPCRLHRHQGPQTRSWRRLPLASRQLHEAMLHEGSQSRSLPTMMLNSRLLLFASKPSRVADWHAIGGHHPQR